MDETQCEYYAEIEKKRLEDIQKLMQCLVRIFGSESLLNSLSLNDKL